jgi:S-methylmethionine-dependent homocysteine/selenocysteine methylase
VLESATWRASTDWGTKLGYSPEALRDVNRRAVALLHAVRNEYESERTPIVVSGCIGPRGDGYNPESFMDPGEAERYHGMQASIFRDADADLVTAITMTYPNEAIGVTRAAAAVGMPVVISFTVETDGRLPNGATLQEAIEEVDAATGALPAYYMINCAHPTHFAGTLARGAAWTARIRGLRANASTKSHAELDQATELDIGDPRELGRQYRELRAALPNLNVLGGCCGTDTRHLEAICAAWQR